MLDTFIIILCFLLIFGVLLYLIMQKLMHVWQDEKVKPKKIALWLWRVAIFSTLIYIIILLLLNQNPLFSLIQSGSGLNFALLIFLFVLIVSLVELTVIDMLLPDIVSLWKRIIIEMISLLLMVVTTVGVFIIFAFIQ